MAPVGPAKITLKGTVSSIFFALRAFRCDRRMLPQLDAAEQAICVAYNLDVLRQLEVDRRRIAAADVQPVVIERPRQLVNRLAQILVPLLLALLEKRAVAEFVFVSLAFVERVMAELEMNPMPLHEEHRSESGAERDDQLVAMAGDASEALHVSVVGDSHRTPELLLQLRLEREIFPSLAEVRRRVDYAVFDHAGKSNRHAVERT